MLAMVAVPAWWWWLAGAAAEWGVTPPAPAPPATSQRGESPQAWGAAVGSTMHPLPGAGGRPRSVPQFPHKETPEATAAAGHRTTPITPGDQPCTPKLPHLSSPLPFSSIFSLFPPSSPSPHPLPPPRPGVRVPPEPGSVARPCHASSVPLSAAVPDQPERLLKFYAKCKWARSPASRSLRMIYYSQIPQN